LVVPLLTTCLALQPGAALADSRADYESSLGTAPDQLHPKALLGHTWVGSGSGIAGRAVVSRGELVLDDRPFDDTGADYKPENGAPFEAAAEAGSLPGTCNNESGWATGDLSYPSGPEYGGGNAADLVQVRVAVSRGQVHVLWVLQTLVDGTTTAVQLLVNQHVVTVTAGGGSLDGKAISSAVDLVGNTFEARLPVTALGAGPWQVNALAGLRSGNAMGSPADLAHVRAEPVGGPVSCRLDAVQSAQLQSGAYDRVTVDPARLTAGSSDPAELTRGSFTRNYVPRLQLGEGLTPQPRYDGQSAANIWRGSVQPYSVYVPKSYDPTRANPLIVLLHCLECHHTVYDMAAFDGVTRLAESRGAVIVMPFGYGEGGWWEGEAEADVFAVMSDASRRYRIDRDRLYLTGMSMGSTGTFRLGLMRPDLWAKLLVVEAATVPFCVSAQPGVEGCTRPFNYVSVFPNARDLPVGIVQGSIDELTPVTSGRAYADTFAAQGDAYRYWEVSGRAHDTRMHGLTSDVTDPWIGQTRVERSPARVTYVTVPAMTGPGESYDRAYWLRGLRVAPDVASARVDAVSGRGVEHTTSAAAGTGEDAAGPWTMRGLDTGRAASSGRNNLTLTTSGYVAMAVDLAGSRLTRREPLTVTVTSDRPLALRVGDAVLQVPTGTTTRTLPAQRSSSSVPSVSSGPRSQAERAPVLASTGLGTTGLAGPLLLLGLVGLRGRRWSHGPRRA
jgi:poly(3-hydroxybutyrate) depolymerase